MSDLTGGIADLLGDLFLITDPANYNIALNKLAGASYANYLQSFSSLGVHYNDLLAKATDCEIPALAGSVLECRASAPLHIWGQLDYQKRKVDGDDEAGEFDAKRLTGADRARRKRRQLGDPRSQLRQGHQPHRRPSVRRRYRRRRLAGRRSTASTIRARST